MLFLIYINDLIKCSGAYSEVYVFADDAKFYRHILSDDDNKTLQYALDALQKWSETWLLNLNITRMWANAQPDGRPAEHRWRPLFNAAKFG